MELLEHVILGLDIVSMALIAATLVVLVLDLKDFWGTPTAEAFVYFTGAVVLLALIKAYLHLAGAHTLAISEATATVGWHLMFYLSMALFIAGTLSLVRLMVSEGSARTRFHRALLNGSTALLGGAAAFVVSVFADSWLTAVFGDSLLDRIGAVHFLAFAVSGGVVLVMVRLRRSLGSYISSIATPIIWAVFFLGLIHFWELLSESWKVVHVEGELGEGIEVLLGLPVFILIFFAFLRTRREVGQGSASTAA